ncbi:phospholipase D family protein [bacterium]|nr:phospholipase D family protein [bacterium]
METTIIGQGYNIDADTSMAKELIKQFESRRFKKFTCLVAFASCGGVSAFTKYIVNAKKEGMDIRIILGIDQKGTSKEALEEVLKWNVQAYVYHTSSNNIFHPKVYLFENEDIFTLIVGSNNLTIPGLVRNVECSLLVKDIKSNPVHHEFYAYWKSILDGTEINLYPITQQFINSLVKNKLVLSDKERAEIYDEKSIEKKSEIGKLVFKTVPLQKFPIGFNPRIIRVKKTGIKSNTPQKTQALLIGNEVLIAEIGGGSRWKQVNFPVNIFENFFGAERGKNNYTIELMNISKDGTLGDVETRQAVSVKSQNYRFEINCKETQRKYPGNEKRPIAIFVKLDGRAFAYHVLLSGYKRYSSIKKYLYNESKSSPRELKRAIVHVEALHAIYPELIL